MPCTWNSWAFFSPGPAKSNISRPAPNERLNLRRIFIGNGQHDKSPVLEFLVERLQIGHLFSDGRAPRRPEIDQHYLALQVLQFPRLPTQILQRKIHVLKPLVLLLQLCGRLGEGCTNCASSTQGAAGLPRWSAKGCCFNDSARVFATSCRVSWPKSPSVDRLARELAGMSLFIPAPRARI